MICATC
ncbi:hypothetical protein EC5905_3747, partial [Escherichia coli 5905]